MIDFLKIQVFDKSVINHITDLPFIHKVNHSKRVDFKTGQVYTTHKFDLDGIIFLWDDYKLTITIKPHYYFNLGMHNANDFKPSDCIKTIKSIISRLQLENVLKRLKIVGLEYGVNFVINAKDTDVLNALYLHSTNEFYNTIDLAYCKKSYKPRPDGKANQHKQYKFYAKALKNPNFCKPNTLRAEVRSNRSAYINRLGITTLDDVLKYNVYHTLKEHLKTETSQLLFIDTPTNLKVLTRKQRSTIKTMSNVIYWRKVLKNNRSKFTLKKEQFLRLLNKTGNNLTGLVITGVNDKLNELFSSKSGLTFSTPIAKKSGLTSTYSIVRDYTTFKICPVTGENITMQKSKSFLLSNTGLKHLEQTNPNRFNQLVKMFITGNHNQYETTLYSQLSKQIRNRYFNRLDGYNPLQARLF